MVIAGALLHFVFFKAVAGLFGQPAATEVAFAVACALTSAADTPVPEETTTLLKRAFCSVATFPSTCWSWAVSGTVVAVVVLVVELADKSVDMPVSSIAVPCRQRIRYVEPDPTRSTAVDPRSFGGVCPACGLADAAKFCKSFVASAAVWQ
jgi:hypothetical protein